MPDYLGKDQRKTKDDKEEEKPIQGNPYHILVKIKSNNCLKYCSLLSHSLQNMYYLDGLFV